MTEEAPSAKSRRLEAVLSRVFALLWLGYLAYPIASLLESRTGTGTRVGEFALLAVFVAVYAVAMTVRMPTPGETDSSLGVVWPLALGVLATVLTWLPGSSWAGLFIFVSAVAARLRPLRLGWGGVGASALWAVLVERVVGRSGFGPDPIGVVILVSEVLAVGIMVLGVTRVYETNAELRRSRTLVAHLAVSEERLRFARDMHDLLGQHLAVIVRKSELATRLVATDPDRARREMRDIERVARDALTDAREVVSGYREPSLTSELAGMRLALEAAGVHLDVSQDVPVPPGPVQAALAWTIREASANVLRHSRCRNVSVVLRQGPVGRFLLAIVDDGPAETLGQGSTGRETHNGLRGLAERICALGGEIHAGPTEGGGFAVRVDVPATTAAPSTAVAPEGEGR